MNWLRVALLVVGVLALIPLALFGWFIGGAVLGPQGAVIGALCGFGAGLVFILLAAIAKA